MTTEFQAGETGTFEVWAETVRVRILQESDLQQDDADQTPAAGFDPYNTDITARAVEPKPRRSLYDMRRLSEAIVRNRRDSKGRA